MTLPSSQSSPESSEGVCTVCAEPLDDSNSAYCSRCGQRFHLQLSNAGTAPESKDCGAVWVNDESMALEFGCQRCLDALQGEAPPPAAPEAGSAREAPRAKRRGGRARDIVRRKRR